MKPVKLTIQSFGSYGDKTEIDFTKPNQDLFLITGNTGSGKSTIFDAIVFALYGEASSTSNKKTGQELKSQFGSPTLEPYVELVFEDGMPGHEKTYTVRRSPAWTRPKLRGTGTVEQNRKVDFYDLDQTFNESGTSADSKIEEVVGLTREQFMQVAMIAQNEFMQVLRASSQDKKAIFSKLFNTEKYARINEVLKARFQKAKEQKDRIEESLLSAMETCSFPEKFAHENMAFQIQQDLKNGERKFSLVQAEAFEQDLDSFIEDLKLKAQELEKQKSENEQESRKIQSSLNAASRLEQDYLSLEKAKSDLESLQKDKDEAEKKEKLMGDIPLSFRLKNSSEQMEQAKERYLKAGNELSQAKSEQPELEKMKAESEADYKEVQQMSTKTIEMCSLEISKADSCLKLFNDLKDAEKKKTGLQKQIGIQIQKQENLRKEKEQLEEKTRQAQQVQKDEASAAIRNQMLKTVRENIREMDEEILSCQNLEKQTAETEIRFQKETARYKQASEKADQLEEKYRRENRLFLDSQAGILAKELREDEPCPVCGSRNHPHPAILNPSLKPPTEEELSKLQQEASLKQEEARNLALNCRDLLNRKEQHKEQKIQMIKQLTEKLEKNNDLIFGRTVSEEKALLIPEQEEERLSEIEKQLKSLKEEDAEKLKASEEQMKEIETASEFLMQSKEKAALLEKRQRQEELAYQELLVSLENIKTLIDEKQKQLSFPDSESAGKARTEAEKNKKQAEETENEARSLLVGCERKLASCLQNIRSLDERLPELKLSMQQTEDVYNQLEKDTPVSLDWKRIVSEYPDEQKAVRSCSDFVMKWQKSLADAQARKEAATMAIQDQKRPDLEKLKEQDYEIQEKKQKIEQNQMSCLSALEIDQKSIQTIRQKMAERKKVSELASRLENLYTLFSGKRSGGKMDLETYVLRAYLREILKAANRRFSEMNGGEFELRMTDLETSDSGRKNRGLDLMVYSNLTGKTLPVNTLSGGESFMAALSMALGMADQIQQNSARLSLDMMFIDEGFGTLDDQTRNQAIRVLQDLTEKQRMIGIISHVSELKQEIEDKLIVKKTDQGSTASWQIS